MDPFKPLPLRRAAPQEMNYVLRGDYNSRTRKYGPPLYVMQYEHDWDEAEENRRAVNLAEHLNRNWLPEVMELRGFAELAKRARESDRERTSATVAWEFLRSLSDNEDGTSSPAQLLAVNAFKAASQRRLLENGDIISRMRRRHRIAEDCAVAAIYLVAELENNGQAVDLRNEFNAMLWSMEFNYPGKETQP